MCVVVPRPPCQGDRPVPREPPRARSSPLHCDQEPSCSMDHEQRAFAPLASTTRDFRIPGPTTGVSTPAFDQSGDVSSPFGNPIDQRLESTWAFALDPRGICGETRRAGRLPCATWPARNEEHPSHIVPPSGCGMSSVRAFGSRGFPPAPLSRAPCSGWQRRARGPGQRFVKRWPRSCFRKPRAWRTCWGKLLRAVPRTQRFCKRRAQNSSKSEPHFLLCSGGNLDSVCLTARRRAEPRHPLAQ